MSLLVCKDMGRTFLGLSLFLALFACKEQVPEPVEPIRAIKTITVIEQATEQIRKFSGLVAAVDSSGLSFQVGGQVDSVASKKGRCSRFWIPSPSSWRWMRPRLR